jgi:hypothetical protein
MATPDDRRRALGIPVHGDDEHEWRSDGWCNCGAAQPSRHHRTRNPLPPTGRTRGHSNLDIVERNGEADNR